MVLEPWHYRARGRKVACSGKGQGLWFGGRTLESLFLGVKMGIYNYCNKPLHYFGTLSEGGTLLSFLPSPSAALSMDYSVLQYLSCTGP